MRSSKKISNSKNSRSPLNLARLSDQEELLLSGILKKPREFLIAHPQTKLKPTQLRKFLAAKQKLSQGFPLAYLLGYRWFFNRKFQVNKNVLIPRPETEQLVERAIFLAKTLSTETIIDVGTGSGAIIVSLRKEVIGTKSFYGVDISKAALKIAKQNARTLHANNIKFMPGNLLAPLRKNLAGKHKVLICANLPYLSKKQLKEPSIKHEPRLALFGGKNPAKKIEQLLSQVSKFSLHDSAIMLEINFDQAKTIKKLANKYLPEATVEIHRDLRGFDRIVEIILPA